MSKVPSEELVQSFIDRHKVLDERTSVIKKDKSELMKEAKEQGLEPKYLRKVIRLSRIARAKRDEDETMTSLYMEAAGL